MKIERIAFPVVALFAVVAVSGCGSHPDTEAAGQTPAAGAPVAPVAAAMSAAGDQAKKSGMAEKYSSQARAEEQLAKSRAQAGAGKPGQ